MNFLLDIDKSQYGDKIIETTSLGETLLFGGKILLIGIVTVFSVLCLIWLCLTVFKSVFQKNTEEKKSTAKAENLPAATSAPVIQSSSDEIVAVIAAAIATAESESATGAKFRVVSFRRK